MNLKITYHKKMPKITVGLTIESYASSSTSCGNGKKGNNLGEVPFTGIIINKWIPMKMGTGIGKRTETDRLL